MEQWFYIRDGQQQGPVNLEVLRNMAQEGDLKADDMVWNATMSDWTPASEIDGIFSGAVAPPPLTPKPDSSPDAPLDGSETTPQIPDQEIEPGSDPINVGACVSRAFELTKQHFWPLLGILLVYIAASFAVGMAMSVVDNMLGLGKVQTIELFGQTITERKPSFLHELVSNVFSIYLSLGLIRIGLNIVDGKPFELNQLFGGGPLLLTGFLASILYGLMIVVGFICLIVPGIYLAIRFSPYMNAIVDRNLGVIDSLKYASNLTTGNRLNLFVLAIMTFLIMLAGLLALIIGLLFTWPLVFLAWIVAYRWMQYGSKVSETPQS